MHYRRIRGDMNMVFKIVTGIMECTVSCNFISSHSVTRRNRYKLAQKHYNLTKFSLAQRIVSIWNGLPDHVVSACSVRIFEKRLDFFWRNQDCLYYWKATITGIGNRSLI